MKKVISMVMAVLLSVTGFAYAADSGETTITKEYYFHTQDKLYEQLTLEDIGQGELSDVRKEIRVHEQKYHAAAIRFEETAQKRPIKRTRNFTGLKEKTVPRFIRLKSGKKLELSGVKWTEYTRQAATGTATYTGTSSKPDAPATKDITAIMPDGSTITVKGRLQRVERTGSSYSKPFTVTAKFTGDRDVAYYKLGNIKIPNNPDTPAFEGYQHVLLQRLGYNPENYQITAGKWTSDYKTEGGQTVRYAEFSGMQKTSDWTAFYTEALTGDSPQLSSYDAVAEYTNGVEHPDYEIKAVVTYEKEVQKGLTLLQKVLLVTAAIAVIALVIGMILMVMKKKKKPENEVV